MTTWTLKLFQNDTVPAYTDTVADYVEADFSGYIAGTAITWGVPIINGSNQGELNGTQINFTHNGGSTANTIYGIFVVDGSGDLLYAERFPAPIAMGSGGDTIPYVPRFTLINQ
jgi:hypothetical protein